MNHLYDRLLQRLSHGLQLLPDKPEETPDSTLLALWHCAAGVALSPELARQRPLADLDAEKVQALEGLVDRRLSGVPLAHITGRQRFLDMEMLAGPEALVPRKETELLARTAITLAQELNLGAAAIAVDVCTGSGNVALAIAQRIPHAKVYAADLSEDAVALARRNASHLGLDSRIEFRSGDLLGPFDTAEFHGKVDLLTCNPPYISSAKVEHMPGEIALFEPHLAFDGGAFGVAILTRLLSDAPRFVKKGGWLAFEIGLGQGPALIRRLQKAANTQEVRPLLDAGGAIRVVAVRY